MKISLSPFIAMLSITLLLASCGASSTKMNGPATKLMNAVTASTDASIDAKLFYDFPVKPLDGLKRTVNQINYYAELKRDGDTSTHQWSLWIERGHAEGFDHGHWLFNLEEGSISEYFVHSGGGQGAAAPAKGGNVVTYLELMKRMQESLQTMQAPEDILHYVSQVIDSVNRAFPFGVNYVGRRTDGTVMVRYLAASRVDILVDVFQAQSHDGVRSSNDKWVEKGRMTVEPGSGLAEIKFVKSTTDRNYYCFDVKAVPVGGDYTQAVAARTFCDGQRPE